MRAMVFILNDEDERKVSELTLNGVLDGKLAKGDYLERELPGDFNYKYVRFEIATGFLFLA